MGGIIKTQGFPQNTSVSTSGDGCMPPKGYCCVSGCYGYYDAKYFTALELAPWKPFEEQPDDWLIKDNGMWSNQTTHCRAICYEGGWMQFDGHMNSCVAATSE
mmetsp:Transcript_24324/g.62142  ORF Transcript_24324/g.62142 Transcript_24324/m.62142 type:complete len:103 (-) Transcript_24324:363-671(-)